MIKKILTLALPLLALIGGVAAGDILRPDDKMEEANAEASPEHGASKSEVASSEGSHEKKGSHKEGEEKSGDVAWFSFPNQFFVPMMRNGDMGAVMILTLSIETEQEYLEKMKEQEHRLRDALLRQLLIRANSGSFDGNFTAESTLGPLRKDLLEAVLSSTDLPVSAVLIEDIARQQG